MKKLKLEPDELSVETFATTADSGGGEGTVEAHWFALTVLPKCIKTCCTLPCPCTPRADEG